MSSGLWTHFACVKSLVLSRMRMITKLYRELDFSFHPCKAQKAVSPVKRYSAEAFIFTSYSVCIVGYLFTLYTHSKIAGELWPRPRLHTWLVWSQALRWSADRPCDSTSGNLNKTSVRESPKVCICWVFQSYSMLFGLCQTSEDYAWLWIVLAVISVWCWQACGRVVELFR